MTQLENKVDEIYQYERRDTIIVESPALPQERVSENSAGEFPRQASNILTKCKFRIDCGIEIYVLYI